MHSHRLAALIATLSGLTACTVGPDFEEPQTALPESFVNAPETTTDGVAIATLWQSLGDATLSSLVDRALEENLQLAQALAVLDETRSLSGLAIYSLFPTVTTSAEQERVRESSDDPFAMGGQGVTERFRAGFDAVWEIDLFGSLRRQSDRIFYLAEADAAAAYAVRIAVVAEVAQAYFQWLGESRRRDLLARNAELQLERVSILEAGLDAGRGTLLDVARARAEANALAASVPLARDSVLQTEQRLAVLVRMSVAELQVQLGEASGLPALPPLEAVGDPIDWFSRRPDIYEADRRLAASTASVGIELAEFYPKLNLVGDFGWTGTSSSAVGDSDADRWRFAPELSWRILDFGRIRQRVDVAEAQLAGDYAAFEETWRLAIEEAENALSGYRAATERAALLEAAVISAREASLLARLRNDAGADSYLVVIDADRGRVELEEQLVEARTSRASLLAALYKAFGGDFARANPQINSK